MLDLPFYDNSINQLPRVKIAHQHCQAIEIQASTTKLLEQFLLTTFSQLAKQIYEYHVVTNGSVYILDITIYESVRDRES